MPNPTEMEQKIAELERIVAQLQVLPPPAAQPQAFFNAVPAPDRFTFKKDDWSSWIASYERYRLATGLDKQEEKLQVNSLLLHMGSNVDQLLATMGKQPEQLTKYDEGKQLFADYYEKKTNIMYERAKFNLRNQRDHETAEEYIADVVRLAKSCKYGPLEEELVRDRLVVGIRDQRLSQQLQMDEKLTLKTASDKITQSESVQAQTKDIRGASNKADGEEVSRVYRKHMNTRQLGKKANMHVKFKEYPQCNRCGAKPSHELKLCPALRATCRKCKIKGHYAEFCKSKVVRQLEVSESSESDGDSALYDYAEVVKVGEITKGNTEPWRINLTISNQKVTFKLDTGADESILTLDQYNNMKEKPDIVKTNDKLYGVGHRKLDTVGVAHVTVTHKLKSETIQIYIVADATENLLGRPSINKLKLIKWIDSVETEANDITEYKQKLITEYPNLFQGLGKIKGTTYDLKLEDNAQPFAIITPRRIPVPLMEKVEKELQEMQHEGVIEEVTDPTQWCAPMVVVTKSNGEIRICADFTELNKHVLRERLQLPSVDETLAQLQEAKIFTKLDANSGFWQLCLTEKSSNYLTFITPFGRFKYKRLPFGICSAPEVYQRIMFEIVGHKKGVVVHMDDIVIFGKNIKEHDNRLHNVLKSLKDHGITLNKKKCQFALTELKFLGHIIGENGVKADPELIEAIKEFRPPCSVTEVRQFLGMVNQITKFVPNAAEQTTQLRQLLRKDNAFMWTEAHQNNFESLKTLITTTPILAIYNTNYKTRVSADASSYGIGGVLEQQQLDGTWKPVIYCSKSLSDVQKRYAQIEKESLAIMWTCTRLQQYLIGKQFTIFTDHKPLIAILKTKPINELTSRLQRFRMHMVNFDYDIEYVPGKDFFTADALSRTPQEKISDKDKDILLEDSCAVYIRMVVHEAEITANTSEQAIVTAQAKDIALSSIKEYVLKGWPEKQSFNKEALVYYKHRNEISLNEGLLCYKDRIIIPPEMRKIVLQQIHTGHQGITKSKLRAREALWWPRINTHIEDLIQNCEVCLKNRNTETEPLMPTKTPTLPWSEIAADLFHFKGFTFLVIQDFYSRFPEVIKLDKTTSESIINEFKKVFARYGIPSVLRSDNGPQFNNLTFKQFATGYNFKHVTSSPTYAQSNGMAERAVQLVKKILAKSEDPYLGLLAYRNTPLTSGASPAQLLMGRRLRDNLPTSNEYLKPNQPDHKMIHTRMMEESGKQKAYYDNRHKAKSLRDLTEGEKVWVTNMQRCGTVTSTAAEPRSYIIQTETGQVRRNRKHLQPLPSTDLKNATETQTATENRHSGNYDVSTKDVPQQQFKPRLGVRQHKPPKYLQDYER